MSTTISAVNGKNNISHALFMDITLGTTTYYVSSAYKPITIGSNTYNQLGYFLQAGSMQDDLKSNNNDMQISLSGVPNTLVNIVLGTAIKGGNVVIKRGFFDTNTDEIISGQVYTRYTGIITNFNVEEVNDPFTGDRTHTVIISCASLNQLLENKISGERTNGSDRKKFYPGDISFDRVKDLQGISFDFGKKYTGGTGYGGTNGGGFYGGGGGRGGFEDFNINLN
jgi:uncharacterized membrane protein YgcG